MRIAIVSDLHIGYERFEADSYKQARDALEKASDVSDAILIAGDVFDKRAPKPEVIAQAVDIFRDVSRRNWKARVTIFDTKRATRSFTDVPIIAIPGTHERVAEGKANVLSLLSLAGLIVDASESTAVISLGSERVAVFGLGGLSEERVQEMLKELDPKPVSGAFNIFMMHQSIRELLPFGGDFIRYEDLPKGFDLYVNGHFHNRVEATVHGKKFLIPGSTVLTQLKDGEQDDKGFILFDTQTCGHQFIGIGSRRFVARRLSFDGASASEIVSAAEAAIEKELKPADTPIIRIVADGTLARGVNPADVSLGSLPSKYAGRAMVFVDSELSSPALDGQIAEVREGKLEGSSIREYGMHTFTSKLKEHKFDASKMDPGRLFEILSSQSAKDKVLKSASELLDQKAEKLNPKN